MKEQLINANAKAYAALIEEIKKDRKTLNLFLSMDMLVVNKAILKFGDTFLNELTKDLEVKSC